ncbi:MAG: ATP-dependent 6-phosphofructokinase, partial [Spirochaetota bacterium]|nr:ATP-dependent 6-phosphofructokinase [Spirochaetota bacterium]
KQPIMLDPELIKNIHTMGGSFLSSSRGPIPAEEIVDRLIELKINMLFTIGGDGTLRGAEQIANEIKKRNLKISIIGIPKTIDNDIPYVAKTFGFESAFSSAAEAIQSAHTEAKGAPNGIGLVKLMGSHVGFIAANAALGLKEVNFVLIPEVDFDLEGENGLLEVLKHRLGEKDHAVIVVAEGAGQKFFQNDSKDKDASGNVKLKDIGIFLKDRINQYFKSINMEINLKYIDPSYIIRSIPANANDSVFCGLLAQNAVHAAMAGKTSMIIGVWNNIFVNLPLHLVTSKRKQIEPSGKLWQSVLESTGQPNLIN